jgi:hypothetical protein
MKSYEGYHHPTPARTQKTIRMKMKAKTRMNGHRFDCNY